MSLMVLSTEVALPQTASISTGSGCVLTAARRHAGGVAARTCAAAAKRANRRVVLANIVAVCLTRWRLSGRQGINKGLKNAN